MTDYSGWTDEQVNEAIAVKRGWKKGRVLVGLSVEHTRWTDGVCMRADAPDYTHDWRLCGELLEEMGNAISDGWEFSCEHNDIDGLEPLKWRVWMTRFTDNVDDFRSVHAEGYGFIRTVDEAWLAWKEQG